jgi:hypothetical protein
VTSKARATQHINHTESFARDEACGAPRPLGRVFKSTRLVPTVAVFETDARSSLLGRRRANGPGRTARSEMSPKDDGQSLEALLTAHDLQGRQITSYHLETFRNGLISSSIDRDENSNGMRIVGHRNHRHASPTTSSPQRCHTSMQEMQELWSRVGF